MLSNFTSFLASQFDLVTVPLLGQNPNNYTESVEFSVRFCPKSLYIPTCVVSENVMFCRDGAFLDVLNVLVDKHDNLLSCRKVNKIRNTFTLLILHLYIQVVLSNS